MHIPSRRIVDGTAGALVAIVLLAGGAAYAASGGFDDNPHGDAPTTEDRPLVVGSAGLRAGEPSSTSTTSSTSSTSTSTTSTPPTTAPAPALEGTSYDVLDAGRATIAVDGAVLRIVRAEPTVGWVARVERDGAREVELSFVSGPARVDLVAELEDGQVRVRIRDRRTEVSTTPPSTTAPTTTVRAVPPTTFTVPAVPTAVRTLGGAGGTVTVRDAGGVLTLVAATPSAGFTADVRDVGPDEVEVRFVSGRRETRIEIEREHGQWRDRVEER